MQKIDKSLYPSSEDIWYASQLKAFAAKLPTIAHRYDLFAVTVLKVQSVALEFMELLIHRMNYASEYHRYQPHTAVASLQMQSELASNWQEYKDLLQKFTERLASHIEQHAAYTAADGQALGLAALARPAPLAVACQEPGNLT